MTIVKDCWRKYEKNKWRLAANTYLQCRNEGKIIVMKCHGVIRLLDSLRQMTNRAHHTKGYGRVVCLTDNSIIINHGQNFWISKIFQPADKSHKITISVWIFNVIFPAGRCLYDDQPALMYLVTNFMLYLCKFPAIYVKPAYAVIPLYTQPYLQWFRFRLEHYNKCFMRHPKLLKLRPLAHKLKFKLNWSFAAPVGKCSSPHETTPKPN